MYPHSVSDKVGCLYVIDFPNGKSYYGITSRGLQRRLREHVCLAEAGRPYALSKALRLYDDWFIAQVLVIAPMKYLEELEVKVIEAYQSRIPNGYNQALGGRLAPSSTSEVRLLLSNLKLGTKHSEATKAKLKKAWESRPRTYRWSDEERKRRAEKPSPRAMLGKKHSPEIREKIRQASLDQWAKRRAAKNAANTPVR